MTGPSSGFIIIDDPMEHELSETQRDERVDWYTKNFPSTGLHRRYRRLDDGRWLPRCIELGSD
jgi:hypothetical protein